MDNNQDNLITKNRWFFKIAGKGFLGICSELDRERGPLRGPQDMNTFFYCVGKLFEEIGAGAPVVFRASVVGDVGSE